MSYPRFSLLIAILCLASANTTKADNAQNNPKFTHVVSWGAWNGSFEVKDLPELLFDGKSMGSIDKAYPKLTLMDVGSRDQIKIEIPIITDLSSSKHGAIYSFAQLLSAWLKKGAHLHFFQGNKEYQLHTLTWSKYKNEDGTWKHDVGTAHVVLDGKDIGQIDVAIKQLNQMTWSKDTLLQLYLPYTETPMIGFDFPSELSDTMYDLAKKQGFIAEEISPAM